MIVYGHRSVPLHPQQSLRTFSHRLEQSTDPIDLDQIRDLAVDFGEVESAVADHWQQRTDDALPELDLWYDTGSAVAAALVAAWHDEPARTGAALRRAAENVATLLTRQLPGVVWARPAEGFAYYSLYPEQYILAAERMLDEISPQSLLTVGIRGIGAMLAHVVAAAAERRGIAANVVTMRPRDHPFNRRVAVSPRLLKQLTDATLSDHVAVVDEGPGLSGSSFAAVCDVLRFAGFDDDRILLFPSWTPPATALRSARGRDTWERHRKFTAGFEEAYGIPAGADLSAGRWRSEILGNDEWRWPPAHPQHERRKYRSTGALCKFAGLGDHGRRALTRASRLHQANAGPRPLRINRGFLEFEWIEGRPMTPTDVDDAIIDRIAEYTAIVRTAFATSQRAQIDTLVEMLRTNVSESIGVTHLHAIDELVDSAEAFDEPEIAVDGRMQPHEWIVTPEQLFKVDALDHHADDFLPGCCDIAWDLAGAIVEMGLTDAAADHLVRQYCRRSADRTIAHRLPFYSAAYLAYRIGYTAMAAESLADSTEAARFTRAGARYRRLLEAAVARQRRTAGR